MAEKSEKFEKLKRRIIRELLDKALYISAAAEVARSITNFATNRSAFSFIEGGIGAVNIASQFFGTFSSDLFNIKQGWEVLVSQINQQPLFDILTPILDTFPSKMLNFKYDNQSVSKIYELPNGRSVGKDCFGLWFYFDEGSKEDILDFLYQETFKSVNSQVFSIVEKNHRANKWDDNGSQFSLKPEKLTSLKSPTATKYYNHIKQAIDKNIHRSVIFIGYPGTGKTSITNTIIQELGLRTLRFKYNPQTTDLNAIEDIIKALKVEAIVMDDLDTVESPIALLGFLERMHNQLKLNIGIVNTLSNIPVAIIRPSRYDEIITINKLDASVIKEVLGDRYTKLYPKVKNWPIAFIKELDERLKINPKINIAQNIKELDNRVRKQIKALKEVSGPI